MNRSWDRFLGVIFVILLLLGYITFVTAWVATTPPHPWDEPIELKWRPVKDFPVFPALLIGSALILGAVLIFTVGAVLTKSRD